MLKPLASLIKSLFLLLWIGKVVIAVGKANEFCLSLRMATAFDIAVGMLDGYLCILLTVDMKKGNGIQGFQVFFDIHGKELLKKSITRHLAINAHQRFLISLVDLALMHSIP